MNTASAHLSNYRQSPRKVGVVAAMVRGKRVALALAELRVVPKRAAAPLVKLIESALANARSRGLNEELLVISNIQVGAGTVIKRRTPRARGSASLIRKRSSHVTLELSERKSSTPQSSTQ